MGKQYQDRDKNFVDYNLGIPNGFDLPLRNGGSSPFYGYGSFIGAAQTFGRFVKYPFPELLEQVVGLHSVNLGIAGAGPRKFNSSQFLLDTINNGKYCVLQVMSGRSCKNNVFDYSQGKWEGTSSVWNKKLQKIQIAEDAWEWYINNHTQTEVEALVENTRENYLNEYFQLIKAIKVPIILLWFSTRKPDYEASYSQNINKLFSSYPHLVNKEMVSEIAKQCSEYVEVVTNNGLPQKLYHIVTLEHQQRTPGDPRSTSIYNEYYPSPEMHYLCAYTLANPIKKIIGEQ
ncbi:DUF6473 family protein [Okeania sp. SIO1I7]|uniref:DUF6473 family protein n=1 Tax=Okeania sp. SIO1I7 TaxID=2607772 RepID=UPI0013F902E4|nr:DUF6473 family protein [Okeania sp. SIO1I7]NET27448.1 hypothetical protein [Okeania sp. SIO1I7]